VLSPLLRYFGNVIAAVVGLINLLNQRHPLQSVSKEPGIARDKLQVDWLAALSRT
jgi:hypothetical protein